jgi:hypothetical protein
MNYAIAQTPDVPSFNELESPVTTVNPIETQVKQQNPEHETALNFPATIKAVSEKLNEKGLVCNPNTLKGRWMNERILPVFEGLDVPEIKTEKGLITDFGFTAIAEVISRCIQGEKGMKIAPESLREEMIGRYGLKPVVDGLQTAKSLLEKTAKIKQESDEQKASSALVKKDAESELEMLLKAAQNLKESEDTSTESYELSEAEKAKLAKQFIARKVAEQEFLQKLERGEF